MMTAMKLLGESHLLQNARAGAVLVAVGFTGLYAVAIVFFYCDWLFDLPGADPLLYGGLLNGSLCLTAAALFLLSRKGCVREGSAIGVGSASYLASLAAVLAASLSSSLLWAYVAAALAGVGAGLLIPLWFSRMGVLARDSSGYVLGISSLVSAPIALALDLLPDGAMVGGCGILVVVSSVLLAMLRTLPCQEDAEVSHPLASTDEEPPGPLKTLAAPLAYVFILSLAYGVLDVVAMASPTATAADSGFASQGGGIVAIGMFLLYVRFGKGRYTALLNASLAVVATGLVFLPFLGGAYSIVLVVLTHVGWEIALLVSYALVIDVFRSEKQKLIGWSAAVFAFPRPGVVLGWLLASLVAEGSHFAFAQMTIIAFALLYLIMMGVWLLRTREKRAAERALRKRDELIKRYVRARDDLQTLACDELSVAHGLTKRETEILRLLAQGRDAAHIEHTLFLSRNTVKSYTKSLYAKLDVHSKQELIDLVNASLEFDSISF